VTPEGDDPKRLGVARLVFGILVLLRTTPLLDFLHVRYDAGASPLLGWPSDRWHVAALGLALPPVVVAALCVGRTLAVVLFALGVWTTAAGVAAGVLGYAVLSQNVMGYVNTLHLLFAGMLVLAVSGAGTRLALRPEPAIDPRSGLRLVRALVASVYAWSGIAKLNGSWLRGDALLQLHDHGIVGGGLAAVLLATPGCRVSMAGAIAATELALGPLLLWPRTRRAAVVAALLLHAVLEASVHPDFFGLAMATLLLSFVEPSRRPAIDKALAS
jgi:Vitamin K-dependent gamma-carboxylase